MKIVITRSREWVKRRRLETGTNVPESIECEVEPAQLSVAARAILMKAGGGAYQDRFDCAFYSDYTLGLCAQYGRQEMIIDEDVPTIEQIDAAIIAAAEALERRRQEVAEEREHKEAEARASADRWAALPLTHRVSTGGVAFCRPANSPHDYAGPLSTSGILAFDRDAIARYRPDALREAEAYSTTLYEATTPYRQRLILLSDLVRAVPQDALIGAIRRLATDEADMLERVNDALEGEPLDI